MSFKKNKTAYIVFIILIIFMMYDFINGYLEVKDIEKNLKYTIGVTYKSEFGAKTGTDIYYYYYVCNIKYTNWANKKKGVKCPNGRYYVQFSSKNPEHSRILFNKPVPKHIKKAPYEGWEENPDW